MGLLSVCPWRWTWWWWLQAGYWTSLGASVGTPTTGPETSFLGMQLVFLPAAMEKSNSAAPNVFWLVLLVFVLCLQSLQPFLSWEFSPISNLLYSGFVHLPEFPKHIRINCFSYSNLFLWVSSIHHISIPYYRNVLTNAKGILRTLHWLWSWRFLKYTQYCIMFQTKPLCQFIIKLSTWLINKIYLLCMKPNLVTL